tara:strand:+ start:1238 stop:3442 length:2205 start_codon:yes stop_codon:yes gene_type:complete
MALGDGGLDAQVEQRMDAYRGNPQKLQQRYGQNKELLDLLALQKLTSEKKQVAADMQLKAQNNPNTIAQQREAEALQLTKSAMGGTLGELAGRTKGTLDQKNALQKQNMGKLAQRAAQPNAGGLGGLNAPSPAPVRMAQGGIVAFKEGEQVGSALSRFFKGPPPGTAQTASGSRNELEAAVRKKFGGFSGIDGLFRNQSDKQRAYAAKVRNSVNSLSDEKLQKLLEVNFTTAMTDTEIAALPNVGVAKVNNQQPEVVNPEVVEEPDPFAAYDKQTGVGGAGNVEFASTYENPQSFLSGVKTSYEPTEAIIPATNSLDESTTALAAAGQQTADPSLLNVADPEVAELKNVAAPYDAEGMEIQKLLLDDAKSSMAADPLDAMNAARESSDVYTRRAENDADFRKMEEEERALQAKLLSPSRLSSEARIATFGGAAQGRGGMSNAYTNIMRKQREDLSGGLGTIRGIGENRINKDAEVAGLGSAAGQNAFNASENRRVGGLGTLQNELAAQDTRSLQGQELTSKKNIAVYNHKSSSAQNTFSAAEKVISRNFATLSETVRNDRSKFKGMVEVNVANAKANNTAAEKELDQLLEVATKKAEYAFKNGELSLTNLNAVNELRLKYEEKAATMMKEVLESDSAYQAVLLKLSQMSEAENPVQFAALEKEARVIHGAHLKSLMTVAPDIFGEQEYLKRLAKQLTAGSPISATTLTNDSVTGFRQVSPNTNPETEYGPVATQ